MHILVVEDDQPIREFVRLGLEELDFQVTACADGKLGYQLACQEAFDLIILDLMLPGMDGMEVLRRLRGEGHQTPVLILSARHSVDERVLGLQSGADDYLVKPFAFAELVARCQTLLRRQSAAASVESLTYQGLTLDLLSREASRDGQRIELKPREFALLKLLMTQPGRVLSKTIILEHVWGFQFDPQTNVVDVLVCRLRSKIDKGFSVPLLQTIRGVGYVLRHER
ncbi:response regulator transcription factor [Photobacterium galatheae]|uniref:Transcriptional regulator n=1 Tax=Photobacterium galatheae TaxID=1654360 RepID=A0A066RW49_9GAMM|nr:response regulator transcription factor [Photobacterium galatheae]KDM93326.1 transcriptional regulator [Photobacterium galatheae]MCM0150448.1 response regulator transcription factor [Photobacterium galatheae]